MHAYLDGFYDISIFHVCSRVFISYFVAVHQWPFTFLIGLRCLFVCVCVCERIEYNQCSKRMLIRRRRSKNRYMYVISDRWSGMKDDERIRRKKRKRHGIARSRGDADSKRVEETKVKQSRHRWREWYTMGIELNGMDKLSTHTQRTHKYVK